MLKPRPIFIQQLHVHSMPVYSIHVHIIYAWQPLPNIENQCGPQKLNNEGMHVVQNGSHAYLLTTNIYYVHQHAITVGCLVVFEGMMAVSRSV